MANTPTSSPSFPSALDWIREEAPDHATTDRERSVRGYSALLNALQSGVPNWLAKFDPPMPMIGREHDAINRYHVRYSGESVPEAARGTAEAFAALLAFARSPALPQITAGHDEGFIPEWRQTNARLGFRAADEVPPPALQRYARPGEAVHRCGISGRLFALPAGAPVPALFYDLLDSEGQDPSANSFHPDDRNPRSMNVHPALAAQGSAAVLAALWGEVRGRIVGLAFELEELLHVVSLIAGRHPEDVPGADMADALTRLEQRRLDGGGTLWEPTPAGWRDVGQEGA